MSRSSLIVRFLRVKVVPVYRCDKCGVAAEGGMMTEEFQLAALPEGAADQIKSLPVSNHYMPVGWSSHGRDHHICPECQS